MSNTCNKIIIWFGKGINNCLSYIIGNQILENYEKNFFNMGLGGRVQIRIAPLPPPLFTGLAVLNCHLQLILPAITILVRSFPKQEESQDGVWLRLEMGNVFRFVLGTFRVCLLLRGSFYRNLRYQFISKIYSQLNFYLAKFCSNRSMSQMIL